MPSKPKALKLNIYKLNESIQDFKDFAFAIKNPPYLIEREHLEGNFQYRLYVQRDKISKPEWTELFASILNDNITNHSSSFVFLIKKINHGKNYFFAMTGGYTAYGLIQKYVEEEFGLKIAEKALDPKKIKNISQTTFTGSDRQILRAVKGYNPAYDVESQRRILKSLDGKTLSPDLIGLSLSGADSLAVKKPITLMELESYFDTITELYNSKEIGIKLQKTFHIVKNEDTLSRLQEKFVADFKNLINSNVQEDTESFFVGYKDYFDFLRCNQFVISLGSNKQDHSEGGLEIESIISFINKFEFEIDYNLLKQITILGLGDNSEEIIPGVGLFYFLYSETLLDDKTYFFIDNKWYELDDSYKKFINTSIEQFLIKKEELPAYRTSIHQDEGAYNEWVPSIQENIACLDKKLSSYTTEICDLYSDFPTPTFYHVKRGWGAKLSHLFAQGLVSAQLFAMDPDYRKECHEKENKIDLKFQQSKYRVVFAIIHLKASEPEFPSNMTYFSKVNLLDTASRIRSFGFMVDLVPIKIE